MTKTNKCRYGHPINKTTRRPQLNRDGDTGKVYKTSVCRPCARARTLKREAGYKTRFNKLPAKIRNRLLREAARG